MERKRDTGERMDALIRAADWADNDESRVEKGTTGAESEEPLSTLETENPLSPAGS
jgi:hypothetical protein